jgi:3-hydroxyisobutyrate dehydrogenase-like beta-hydroxyacid dehydrogenase
MKICFIGLGKMGKPIALNLLKSGEDMTVYDKNTSSFDEFRAKGAKTTDNMKTAISGDIVFLCLPSSNVIESIFYEDGGAINLLSAEQIVVDLSTINYSTTMKLAKDLASLGVDFMDAPVSGMEARAIEGTLTVMCGGSEEIYKKILPLFTHIADKVIYMGVNGSGQLTKLINQLLFDINVAALAEILPMSVKMGLSPEKISEVVNSGTGRSFASEFFIPRIMEDIFDEGYPMSHAYKDLISAAELGAASIIPLPVLSAATAAYQISLLKGYGNCGKGAMIKVYEELLGVEFRKAAAKTE